MQNIKLKNQKQLHNYLPTPQLGIKYSQITQKLVTRNLNQMNSQNHKKNPPLSQYSSLKSRNHQKKQQENITPKQQPSLQQSQLDYFKQLNTKMKIQNLHLREDLKICQQKLKKITEEKNKNQEKLTAYYKAVSKSEKKISSLMEFAQHLIVAVKDRLLADSQNNNKNIGLLQNDKSQLFLEEQVDEQKIPKEHEAQKIKLMVQDDYQLRMSTLKKKTIDVMVQEHKAEVQKQSKVQKNLKKSHFHSSTVRNGHKVTWDQHITVSNQMEVEKDNEILNLKEDSFQLLNTVKSFQNEVKSFTELQTLIKQVMQNFDEQTQTESGLFDNKLNQLDAQKKDKKQILNYVFQQIGTFFNNLKDQSDPQFNKRLRLDSNVINEKVKPNNNVQRVYKSIKQIFDHQIYLLQSQKMHFLQCKNKRLLKFIYECNGCEKYEEMLSQIFRILRQGFKEIKLKILPEMKNKIEDQFQILF